MADRYYITTPIYYPNGEPHLGHAYTTVAADTVARYHRLCGRQTFFLTGTDEHGVKMVKTAAEQGLEPKALADRNVKVFQQFWKELGITYDDFLRTTEPRHTQGVQKIVEKLQANDDIYLGSYEGWYDEGQEEFVTETEAKANGYKSVISGRPLTKYQEPTYFFRLSKYVPRVLEHVETYVDFVRPETRRNEVLSKLRAGVDDLSISRATLKWGIPMPRDPKHVVYVWIDALTNYITALGYGAEDASRFDAYWPADVHLIGKEILWFHAVYWPAMLMSLGLPLPRCVFAHGWWVAEGRKMSKTVGNFVDMEKLRALAGKHSVDALRYYLLQAAPFGSDLDWTEAGFAKSYADLADIVGNCLNRMLKMLGSYRGGKVPQPGEMEDIDQALAAKTEELEESLADAYDELALQKCATLPVELARATNGYIDATAPFRMFKDPGQARRLDTVLHVAARAIHAALVGLLPIMPEKAAAGLAQLGTEVGGRTLADLFVAAPGAAGVGKPLFPKELSRG